MAPAPMAHARTQPNHSVIKTPETLPPYPGGPEGFDASKHDSSSSKIKPEGKYKVAPQPDDVTNRTNDSDTVHSIGESTNPNVTISD